jgi:uncharacterized protein YdaU (DUF1376 family)
MQTVHKSDGKIKADRTPFLKLYTDDWIAGTLELNFEEKGFYFEVLLRMWDRKGTLPDDANWLACALGCNPRTVRKLVARLAATGHLQVADGVVSNRRMMREISQNVTKTHRDQGESSINSAPIRCQLDSNSTGTMAKSSMISTRVLLPLPETIFQKPDSNQTTLPADDDVVVDTTEDIFFSLAKWQNMPRANSAIWLASFVKEFGQEVVEASYQTTIRALASKQMIAQPIRYWSQIANNMKRQASEKPKNIENSPTMAAIARRKAAKLAQEEAAHG